MVSIDAGHVRTARGHQGRTFEVMAAQVSNDDGKPVLFSGVPGEADQQDTQLNGVLSGLGMTAETEVTILSDGADGLRSLGEESTITLFDGMAIAEFDVLPLPLPTVCRVRRKRKREVMPAAGYLARLAGSGLENRCDAVRLVGRRNGRSTIRQAVRLWAVAEA